MSWRGLCEAHVHQKEGVSEWTTRDQMTVTSGEVSVDSASAHNRQTPDVPFLSTLFPLFHPTLTIITPHLWIVSIERISERRWDYQRETCYQATSDRPDDPVFLKKRSQAKHPVSGEHPDEERQEQRDAIDWDNEWSTQSNLLRYDTKIQETSVSSCRQQQLYPTGTSDSSQS